MVHGERGLTFREAMNLRISRRKGCNVVKTDDICLIGLYSCKNDNSCKFIVCDSARSKNYVATISDRLEFDNLQDAENYYNECRRISAENVAHQISKSFL